MLLALDVSEDLELILAPRYENRCTPEQIRMNALHKHVNWILRGSQTKVDSYAACHMRASVRSNALVF